MYDNHLLKFKEKTPEATVQQIKSILNDLGIKMIETWIPASEIGTYSLRISPENIPSIGTNGKGVSEKYAQASAYAEFMERMQNMRLTSEGPLYRIYKRNSKQCYAFSNENLMTIEELVDDDNAFLRMFFEGRGLSEGSREEKIEALHKVQKVDFMIHREADKFLCKPYYSVREKRICYVPIILNAIYYVSNGMSAGNTLSEAMVQSLSEIYERYANSRILTEMTALPDVPLEKIQRYPDIYAMYRQIADDPNYTIFLKDASYGGIFPVMALILIEKNTGKFGVKLGAHPDPGIAMERTFTEATQGVRLEKFCRKSDLSFLNEELSNKNNLINSYRTSDAQYPYQILLEPSTYPYFDFPDVSSLSNDDLLKRELDKLISQGRDVLVNDCSFTGFPSCQIIVPGLSEVGSYSDDEICGMVQKISLQDAVCHPKLINKNICEKLIHNLQKSMGKILEHNLYYYTDVTSSFQYPGSEWNCDMLYMIVVCALQIKDYEMASEHAHLMYDILQKKGIKVPTECMLLVRYTDGMRVLKDHQKVMDYLQKMFDEKSCSDFDAKFRNHDKILETIYPEVDLDGEYCGSFRNFESFIVNVKNYQSEHPLDWRNLIDLINKLNVHAEE